MDMGDGGERKVTAVGQLSTNTAATLPDLGGKFVNCWEGRFCTMYPIQRMTFIVPLRTSAQMIPLGQLSGQLIKLFH